MISIGVYRPKFEVNVGTFWRAAHLYGAAHIFTVGYRYTPRASDTTKAWRSVPLINYVDDEAFFANRPFDAPLVGVELDPTAEPLPTFSHPKSAVYLLGAEDHGLPPSVLRRCQHIVQIPTVMPWSMNVAMAGSVILYDRHIKADRQKLRVAA